ncbi:recombinase family protein [Streptomyces sp. NRRL S-1824]|uniref:recombinase family protein n=1 Tax=Streptomyces sp. NRRL S-1824 TaxID=1463889 RepID=UPI0004C9B266|nr:recombinase family protein [Streptomyces sp. NRRL S-1824]
MTTPENAKLVIYLRLSRDSEDSASLDTQRAAAHRWLEAHGHDPAEAAEYLDAGVSGAKPLEQRAGMSALMDARPSVIVAWKLDRYARSVSEFLRLVTWSEAHCAALATTDGTIDTTSPTGRMVATALAALAEWERSMITSRIVEGHETRRNQGRWSSGPAPYGYRIERRDSAAYLAVDAAQATLVRAAIAKLVDGGTVTGTAPLVGLTDRAWRSLLKSATLRGQREYKGALVLAEDGITPVQFAEPIITAADAKAIRERLAALATGTDRAPRKAAPMCAGLAFCERCGGRLNGGMSEGVPRYKCKAGHVSITAAKLDERVEAEFLATWGEFTETVVRREGGNDLSAEMIEAQEQAERLGQRMKSAGPLMISTLESMAEELEAAYAALRAAHDPEVREVPVPTGRTLATAWEDTAERTRLLAGMGLRVELGPKRQADRLSITWGPDHAADAADAALRDE